MPNPIDVYVGAKIRSRRKMLGLSQTALAEALGLTFQQIQKYERGFNRVSASKLFETSVILDVPFDYFVEGLPREDCASLPAAAEERALLEQPGVLAFARALAGMTREQGHAVLALAKAMAPA